MPAVHRTVVLAQASWMAKLRLITAESVFLCPRFLAAALDPSPSQAARPPLCRSDYGEQLTQMKGGMLSTSQHAANSVFMSPDSWARFSTGSELVRVPA